MKIRETTRVIISNYRRILLTESTILVEILLALLLAVFGIYTSNPYWWYNTGRAWPGSYFGIIMVISALISIYKIGNLDLKGRRTALLKNVFFFSALSTIYVVFQKSGMGVFVFPLLTISSFLIYLRLGRDSKLVT
jgi:hypothetical protein